MLKPVYSNWKIIGVQGIQFFTGNSIRNQVILFDPDINGKKKVPEEENALTQILVTQN
ncbi:hypothetical protein SAMN05661012_00625 [Chitinophaga sancti]|uniref:Uncharacterized protein n=1 Tax=Chitinophaga sancti TaxID=1004 RepID=A0A1K1MJ50_9BACT|nr:hypothetical protein SAMN05661012_00625 [Chitinophaga sancti]